MSNILVITVNCQNIILYYIIKTIIILFHKMSHVFSRIQLDINMVTILKGTLLIKSVNLKLTI